MTYDLNDPLVRAAVVGFIISLPLKIISIWKAAQNNQKVWFGALLIFNTLGLLELIYLFYFSKPKNTTQG
jgi:hypothetical protein